MIRRTTLAALAATMLAGFASAEASDAVDGQDEALQPPETPLTDETVPVFVSHEVVQPLPQADTTLTQADSLRELVAEMPRSGELSREMECLAGAIYFESRGEPLAGQLAVGQVVINRSESPDFPSDYCGVVFQPAQFSFVRHGRMPRIDRSSAAWDRAVAIARIAHEGLWESKAADALYFHADYVHPRWSRTKVALATIDTHIFYR